jgi:hypothetical protein
MVFLLLFSYTILFEFNNEKQSYITSINLSNETSTNGSSNYDDLARKGLNTTMSKKRKLEIILLVWISAFIIEELIDVTNDIYLN